MVRMVRKLSGWLAITLTLVTVFGGYPPNKHGTIISYAQEIVATPSNAVYPNDDFEEHLEIATPSEIEKDEHVHIKENAEKIDISDLSNVSILDKANELDVDVSDNVAVKIPVRVDLDGYSTETSFEVEVIGTMSEDSVLSIVPDRDFELKSLYKENISGHVELEHEEVYKTDLDENGRTSINGKITLDRMVTAGKWDGDFNISVCLLSPELEDVEWEYMQSIEDDDIEEPEIIPEIATDSNAKPVSDVEEDKHEEESVDNTQNENMDSIEDRNECSDNDQIINTNNETNNIEEIESEPIEETETPEEIESTETSANDEENSNDDSNSEDSDIESAEDSSTGEDSSSSEEMDNSDSEDSSEDETEGLSDTSEENISTDSKDNESEENKSC